MPYDGHQPCGCSGHLSVIGPHSEVGTERQSRPSSGRWRGGNGSGEGRDHPSTFRGDRQQQDMQGNGQAAANLLSRLLFHVEKQEVTICESEEGK